MDWLLQTIEHGGITHNGMFHADDVLSTCLLRLVKPDFQYQRVDTVFKDLRESPMTWAAAPMTTIMK